jgi:hypothetical protein
LLVRQETEDQYSCPCQQGCQIEAFLVLSKSIKWEQKVRTKSPGFRSTQRKRKVRKGKGQKGIEMQLISMHARSTMIFKLPPATLENRDRVTYSSLKPDRGTKPGVLSGRLVYCQWAA